MCGHGVSQVEKSKPFERLPVDVLPRNYPYQLKPDLNAFTFQGSLQITVDVAVLNSERERGREGEREREREGERGRECVCV